MVKRSATTSKPRTIEQALKQYLYNMEYYDREIIDQVWQTLQVNIVRKVANSERQEVIAQIYNNAVIDK